MIDHAQQYRALTTAVGQIDLSQRTKIEVTGADRAAFLHNMCTNEVKKLTPGTGCEAFFTNVQGKIQGHGYIYCQANSMVIDTVLGAAETLIGHLDRYIIREDVQIADRTGAWTQRLICGPQAAKLIGAIFNTDVPAATHAHCLATFNDEFRVTICRTDWVAGDALVLRYDAAIHQQLQKALADAGALMCDTELFEILRIENGTPLYGQDISANNLPQELSRDPLAINFNKGCYLGQETVARIDALGHVNRMLVGLQVAGDPPAAETELIADGKPVGKVTSAVFSPKLSAVLALAFVRRGHHTPGQNLDLPTAKAKVIELPV